MARCPDRDRGGGRRNLIRPIPGENDSAHSQRAIPRFNATRAARYNGTKRFIFRDKVTRLDKPFRIETQKGVHMDDLAGAKTRWIGTWQNIKGSVMRIRDCVAALSGSPDKTEHFRIAGTYQTAAGRVPSSALFPVTGYVTNDQIAFCVSFRFEDDEERDGYSLTAWAGQILPIPNTEDKQHLKTLWHLVPNLNEGDIEDEYGWVIAWAGSDIFEKLSSDPNHDIPDTN